MFDVRWEWKTDEGCQKERKREVENTSRESDEWRVQDCIAW